jgi:hypothetical protein
MRLQISGWLPAGRTLIDSSEAKASKTHSLGSAALWEFKGERERLSFPCRLDWARRQLNGDEINLQIPAALNSLGQLDSLCAFIREFLGSANLVENSTLVRILVLV